MSEAGVIPRPEDRANCDLCRDTGWITRVDPGGDGYDIPCPEGCPGPVYAADDIFPP